MTHICVGNLNIVGSDNGLSPGRRQAIIWTNARILLFGSLGTNFNEVLIEFDTFSLKKMYLKRTSPKLRPCCFSLNVLNHRYICHSVKMTHLLPKSIKMCIPVSKMCSMRYSKVWYICYKCICVLLLSRANEYFGSTETHFWRKICQNLLAQLTVLLASSHWTMGYTELLHGTHLLSQYF